MKYINLRAYTTASMNFGIFNIDEAIKKSKSNPEEYSPSFAITERNNMFSVIDFYKSAKKISNEEFKFNPIVGSELIFAKEKVIKYKSTNDSDVSLTRIDYEKYPLLLIAKNNDGAKNIFKLQTLFYKSQKQDKITESIALENKELFKDVYVLSGGNDINSFLFNNFKRYINEKDNIIKDNILSKIKEEIKFWKEISDNNYFIELQRDGAELENEYIKFIVPLSIEMGVPVVATNNTYFLNKEDYGTHELFMAHKNNRNVYSNNSNSIKVTPENYLKSNSEMTELFKDIPIALENSYEIGMSTSIDFQLNKHNYLPEIESPNKGETINEYFTRLSDEGLDELMLIFLNKYIANETPNTLPKNNYFNGFLEWFDLNLELDLLSNEEKLNIIKETNLYKEYKERLDYEVGVIINMGFPSYFLVVSDFIKWSKNNDIPVGPGRGSGAGSLVAYALKITDLDPMQFGLLFERFLNPERVSMPDFDIDFSSSTRNKVIEYVRKKYNKDGDIYVSQIMNVGTYDVKSSIEMAAKSYGLKTNHPIVTNIKKLVGVRDYIDNDEDYIDPEDDEIQYNDFFEELKENHSFQVQYKNAPLFRDIVDLASKYYGNMRNVSKHAAGIVISSQRLDSILPLINISGSDVTQLNKDNSEALGVIKFDFLALENLTVMHHALIEINKRRVEKDLDKWTMDDLSKIDIYDEEIYKNIFQKGNTSNVFQFASYGMKNMITNYKPDCFEDLIALVSLYRPGPMDIIPEYIDTKLGRKEIVDMAPSCPEVKEVLKETYGFIVYQEQVMKIAQVYAGYSYGGADLLRRAMGKKKIEEMEKQKEVFISGALKTLNKNATESEIDEKREEAEKLFHHMEKFASYGFNKSHAAAYSMISFQTAWLKHYYPKEYLMAVLHSNIRTSKKAEVIEEVVIDAKINGVNISGVDINSSKDNFYIDDNGNVVMPFTLVKGLPENLAKKISHIRNDIAIENNIKESSVFENIYDFTKKMHENDYNLSPTFLIELIKVGAFSKIEDNNKSRFLIENAKGFIDEIKSNKVQIKSNILKTLPSSYIKSAYKAKNYSHKIVEVDERDEITLSEELTNIKKSIGFIVDESKIKKLVISNNDNKNIIIKNNDNLGFNEIFSTVGEIKNNINNLIEIERENYYEAINSAKNPDSVKFKKDKIKNMSIVNGVLINIIESKYKDKFECKFATEDGIHTLITYNTNFLKVDFKLFDNYYFLINSVVDFKSYNPLDAEQTPSLKMTVKDVFPFNNMFEQIVEYNDIVIDKFNNNEDKKNFILNIINDVENSYTKLEKANNIKYNAPIKLNVYGDVIDLSFSEKIEYEFIKNDIYINTIINNGILNKNNKINIEKLTGNITDVISIEDGLNRLKSNEVFSELNKYVDLSTSKISKEDVSQNYEHLIYGYIKEIKLFKHKISGMVIVDSNGVEINLSGKNFAENNIFPKLPTNKPALFKVSYNRSSTGNSFYMFRDVYFEDDINRMDILNEGRIIDIKNKEDVINLAKENNLLSFNNEDKKITLSFETKDNNIKYIANDKIEVKYNGEFVKEIENKFNALVLFDFNKTHLNPYNFRNNAENDSSYGFVKNEFLKETSNEDMLILNNLYTTNNEKFLNNNKINKNKITDLFDKIEEINLNGENLASSKETKRVMVCVTPVKIEENGFGSFVTFADSTGTFETKVSGVLEDCDLNKMIEDGNPIVMKVDLNLVNNKGGKTLYKNVNEIFSMESVISNLVKFIVIKTDINNYDSVRDIASKYKDTNNNNNNTQIILKDGDIISNKDNTKKTIVAKYSKKLINELKDELKIENNDDIYINLINNGLKLQNTIMNESKEEKKKQSFSKNKY